MTNNEAIKILQSNFDFLLIGLKQRYKNNPNNPKFALKHYNKAKLEIFEDVALKYLLNPSSKLSLVNYKLPQGKELSIEGVLNDYKRGLYTNILPLLYLKTERIYKQQRKEEARYIPMSTLTYSNDHGEEKTMDYVDERENTEDNALIDLLKQSASIIITHIQDYLCLTDLKILKAKMENSKLVDLEKELNISDRTIRTRWQGIQYKLIAYICINKALMLDTKDFINAFNNFPFLNKKYFGIEKLESLPLTKEIKKILKKGKDYYQDQDTNKQLPSNINNTILDPTELKNLVTSYDHLATPVTSKGPNTPCWKSSLDMTGKRHKRPVVFINGYGQAYDHVNKVSFYVGDKGGRYLKKS